MTGVLSEGDTGQKGAHTERRIRSVFMRYPLRSGTGWGRRMAGVLSEGDTG